MANHRGVKDGGAYFRIDPNSRKVIIPHTQSSIGTVGDHCSEQITFECPQMIDGHDVSQCALRYVTWINVHNEYGHDELQLAQVEQGAEGMIYLTWTIRNSLTVAKGVVQFSVHFEDKDSDGTTLYRWGTATCKDCDILDSVNAVVGAYEAIYVAGEALVFSDYNLVEGHTLSLETNGLIPEGTLRIEENGTYDIGEFAQVDVAVSFSAETPQIEVSEDGIVKATANGVENQVQLSAEHDPELVPENIKKGANIFGVEGTVEPFEEGKLPLVTGYISLDTTEIHPSITSFGIEVFFIGKIAGGDFKYDNKIYMETTSSMRVIQVAQNTPILITPVYYENGDSIALKNTYKIDWEKSSGKDLNQITLPSNEYSAYLVQASATGFKLHFGIVK